MFWDGWPIAGIILVCTEEQEQQYKPKFTVEEAADGLPGGILRVSPLVRLECQNQEVPFEPRIRVFLPACSLADSAWRSTEDGWEEIEWKAAGDGYVLLRLEHFCDVFVGTTAREAPCLTAEENSTRRLVDAGVNAFSSLIEKLRPPRPPYDVRTTRWYEKYFQMNVHQIENCLDKANPTGSIKWRETKYGSFLTLSPGAPGAGVVKITLLGVNPPSVANVATIKEFQSLHEDCLEAQMAGKIPADAELIFTRVSERLLVEQIECELAQGRCAIIASCNEDQRDVVYQSYKQLLERTPQKERLQFTPLKRDAPIPLPAESQWWKRMRQN